MPLTYSEQGILIVESKRALWNLITYIRLASLRLSMISQRSPSELDMFCIPVPIVLSWGTLRSAGRGTRGAGRFSRGGTPLECVGRRVVV